MYYLKTTERGIIILLKNNENNYTSIPEDESNTDYQAYLKWVSEGNIAEQAD